MLIPLDKLVKQYDLKLRGVLHIGAHECEEAKMYESLGMRPVTWLEANPVLGERQRKLGFHVVDILASDTDGVSTVFNIANNGQSSSMLAFGEHSKFHPDVHYTHTITLKTKRVDTLIREQKWDMSKYNFLNLDIQGVELRALKGMGPYLDGFDVVYTEVNTGQVYEGCNELKELDEFMAAKGFYRAETKMTDCKWGDALYLRRPAEKVLLDIGAHGGLYGATYQHEFDRVVMVDPLPGTISKDGSKCTIDPKLVVGSAASASSASFYQCVNDNSLGSTNAKWRNAMSARDSSLAFKASDLKCEQVTLEQLYATNGADPKTSMIKINVNGSALDIVSSMTKHLGAISLDWIEEMQSELLETVLKLSTCGYTMFCLQDSFHAFTPKVWINGAEMIKLVTNTFNPTKPTKNGMLYAK